MRYGRIGMGVKNESKRWGGGVETGGGDCSKMGSVRRKEIFFWTSGILNASLTPDFSLRYKVKEESNKSLVCFIIAIFCDQKTKHAYELFLLYL